MRFLFLIWSGLWRRKLRTVFTLLSGIVAFFLFGMLQGVNSTLQQLSKAAHVDRLITGNPSLLPLPLAYLADLERVPGVTSVTYANAAIATYRLPTNRVFLYAIDPDEYFKIYPETVASLSDRKAMKDNFVGALASLSAAKQFGWKRGDRISVKSQTMSRKDGTADWPVQIVGFCNYTTSPDTPMLLINYKYLDAARLTDKSTVQRFITLIKDPASSGALSNAIDANFANGPIPTTTQTEKEFAEAQMSQIGDVGFFVNAIVSAVFFTLVLLLGNSLMQSFRERTREFAVMKAVGYSDLQVAAIVTAEALVLCVMASVLGLSLASLSLPLLGKATGGLLPAHPSWALMLFGFGIALLTGVVSGAVPAWLAQRLPIAKALVFS